MYRSLGPTRSIVKVSQRCSKNRSLLALVSAMVLGRARHGLGFLSGAGDQPAQYPYPRKVGRAFARSSERYRQSEYDDRAAKSRSHSHGKSRLIVRGERPVRCTGWGGFGACSRLSPRFAAAHLCDSDYSGGKLMSDEITLNEITIPPRGHTPVRLPDGQCGALRPCCSWRRLN